MTVDRLWCEFLNDNDNNDDDYIELLWTLGAVGGLRKSSHNDFRNKRKLMYFDMNLKVHQHSLISKIVLTSISKTPQPPLKVCVYVQSGELGIHTGIYIWSVGWLID